MDSVIASYNVDEKKTLLTGFSMGGRGTWYLAGRNQGVFAAAIPVAGSPAADTDEWEVPLYVIHSRQDRVLPLQPTQQYVDKLKENGADIRLVVIDGVTHYETGRFAEPLQKAVPWIRNAWK